MFFLHWCVCRFAFFRSLPQQSLVVALAFLCTGGEVAVLSNSSVGVAVFIFIHSMLLAHVYFHIFNMSETARRIRLLLELREGGVAVKESSYSPQQLIQTRLNRLRETRAVYYTEGIYRSRPSPLLVAALIIQRTEEILFPYRQRS